ncbi:hypothetical protein [Sphingomonas sp. R86520]|uniref:hypothetical protein n=1 Tax=Sphingomonas sp. R86520 TaxID=3093859 RepID=UPI0036D24A2F
MIAGERCLRVRRDACRLDGGRLVRTWRQRGSERREILGDGPRDALPSTPFVNCVGTLQLLLSAGIGHDRAAIHLHVAPRYQPGRSALGDHLLEQQTMQVAGAEATVPALGGSRMIRHPIGQNETTEPPVRRG